MPLYFFDVYNHHIAIDDEGQDLPDLEAVRREVRDTLPSIIRESVEGKDKAYARIDVRDAGGRRVMTSTAVMLLDGIEVPD